MFARLLVSLAKIQSLCLAKNSCASKMARFALSLLLNRKSSLGQGLARRFSLGNDLGRCRVDILRMGGS